jgi:hypothetical protein
LRNGSTGHGEYGRIRVAGGLRGVRGAADAPKSLAFPALRGDHKEVCGSEGGVAPAMRNEE